MMRRVAWTCALSAVVLLRAHAAFAHGAEMMLGSTAKASGALALSYEFTDPVVVSPSISLGGMTLYTSEFPGIEWLQQDDPPFFALKVGTPFSMQIVSIDPGASVMVGGTTLNAAGKSAFVATTTNVPGDHFHPLWQLLLPDGVTGTYAVSFKLTTTSKTYTASQVYSLIITNIPEPPTETPTETPTATATETPTLSPVQTSTPTPIDTATSTFTITPTPPATETPTTTPSATPSETPTPSPTASPQPLLGDANCDDAVTAADLPASLFLYGTSPPFACGADVDDNQVVDERDQTATIALLFEP